MQNKEVILSVLDKLSEEECYSLIKSLILNPVIAYNSDYLGSDKYIISINTEQSFKYLILEKSYKDDKGIFIIYDSLDDYKNNSSVLSIEDIILVVNNYTVSSLRVFSVLFTMTSDYQKIQEIMNNLEKA